MKFKDLEIKIAEEREAEKQKVCSLCHGTGIVHDGKGKEVHTCWRCLHEGKLT